MNVGACLWQADRLTVVDKPPGVRSEAVADAFGKKLVHRLDQATSGLLVLADDARTVSRMHKLLAAGGVTRRYRFLAHGEVPLGQHEVWLVRDRGDGLRGVANAAIGKHAALRVTAAQQLQTPTDLTLGEVELVTGRTHQIRIQLAHLGCVLVGEPVYVRDARARGETLLAAPRLMLHAETLVFVHPNSHAPVRLHQPAPDFVQLLTSAASAREA